MELYVEPKWAKKDGRFKLGHTPWNKGKAGFVTTDPVAKRKILENLELGRRLRRENGKSSGGRKRIVVSAYDLNGNYVKTFNCIADAGRELQLPSENIKACVNGKRHRVGNYMFRMAQTIDFQGKTLVKKSPINPYTRKRTNKDC